MCIENFYNDVVKLYREAICKVHVHEKYLHNDDISSMLYVFDNDVHILTILINVHVGESMNLIEKESKSWIAVCCNSMTQK